jgi:hypothetical protein
MLDKVYPVSMSSVTYPIGLYIATVIIIICIYFTVFQFRENTKKNLYKKVGFLLIIIICLIFLLSWVLYR